MRAAHAPGQRRPDARLLVVDARGRIHAARRRDLIGWLRPGDLLVANDAATLPASLSGIHARTGEVIEVRLAGRPTLAPDRVREFTAVAFGAGDHRTRTEDRPPPPALRPGDGLVLGPLRATVLELLDHPRVVRLRFDGTPDTIWSGIARHGRPIQYAHVATPLAMWDVWTPVAALPVAFEAPSAGFVLDWTFLAGLRRRGIAFATVTLAAGISSTGDPALDARLPLDEPYDVPAYTVQAVARAHHRGGRVVAVGTTATRALEDSARCGGLRAGAAVATLRIGPRTPLHVVDAIISGTHEPDESHFQLLRAFTADDVLRRATATLDKGGYLSHEFGDSMLVERLAVRMPARLRMVKVGGGVRRGSHDAP